MFSSPAMGDEILPIVTLWAMMPFPFPCFFSRYRSVGPFSFHYPMGDGTLYFRVGRPCSAYFLKAHWRLSRSGPTELSTKPCLIVNIIPHQQILPSPLLRSMGAYDIIIIGTERRYRSSGAAKHANGTGASTPSRLCLRKNTVAAHSLAGFTMPLGTKSSLGASHLHELREVPGLNQYGIRPRKSYISADMERKVLLELRLPVFRAARTALSMEPNRSRP